MDIKTAIEEEHSKRQAVRIANYIGTDATRMQELVNLVLANSPKVSQRGAYALSYCGESEPEAVWPHLTALIRHLETPAIHDGVKRCILKVVEKAPLTEEQQGLAANYCFEYATNPQEAIAVRAFSMTVLFNIGLEQPELLPELKLVVEEMMVHGGPAIQSRGQRILKAMHKMNIR